jgi:hypothetical protein
LNAKDHLSWRCELNVIKDKEGAALGQRWT